MQVHSPGMFQRRRFSTVEVCKLGLHVLYSTSNIAVLPLGQGCWTELHGLSPQANYTDQLSDRRLWAKLVPTLADRGCRVVSAMIPPQSLISVF
jgi:hypothetical protein